MRPSLPACPTLSSLLCAYTALHLISGKTWCVWPSAQLSKLSGSARRTTAGSKKILDPTDSRVSADTAARNSAYSLASPRSSANNADDRLKHYMNRDAPGAVAKDSSLDRNCFPHLVLRSPKCLSIFPKGI